MFPIVQRAFHALNDRFTRQLVADDDALLVQFRMLNDAEENGEAAVFAHVAGRLPPKLAALVRRHAEDEVRHLSLTRRALALLNDRPELTDGRADLVAFLDDSLGHLLTGGDGSDADLGRAYLLLHALERRMSAQLGQLGRALRGARPELADIVEAIRADELRHVTWCEVVAFELLGRDAVAHAAIKAEMIALEARVFPKVTHQNLDALLDVGLKRMPVYERALWRAVAFVLRFAPSFPVGDRTGELAERAWSVPARAPALAAA